MDKYDLVLIGNLILTTTYKISSWPEENTVNPLQEGEVIQLGGILDIAKHFPNAYLEAPIGNDSIGKSIRNKMAESGLQYCLHHHDKNSSQALILESPDTKTQFVNWGGPELPFSPNFHKARWTHFGCLDTLPTLNLEKFKECSDIVSAELCLTDPTPEKINTILPQLKYLDYLFIFCDTLHSYFGEKCFELFEKYNIKNIIYYSNNKTLIYQSGDTNWAVIENPPSSKEDQGKFIAGFIEYQLNNEKNIKEAVLIGYKK